MKPEVKVSQNNVLMKKSHKRHETCRSTSKTSSNSTRILKSKAYVAFLNRLATYKRDLDLLDILSRTTNVLPNVDTNKYTSFSEISLAEKDVQTYINHFKSTVHEGVLKNVYELMMLYFRNIIESVLKHGVDPVHVLGESSEKLELSTIVKAGSWDGLLNKLSKIVLKRLEGLKDTTKLTETLAKRLSISVDGHYLDSAKPYFAMRHLLVHNNGLPDEDFKKKNPGLIVKGEIEIKYKGVKKAIDAIGKSVEEFDKALITHNIIAEEDCQG